MKKPRMLIFSLLFDGVALTIVSVLAYSHHANVNSLMRILDGAELKALAASNLHGRMMYDLLTGEVAFAVADSRMFGWLAFLLALSLACGIVVLFEERRSRRA